MQFLVDRCAGRRLAEWLRLQGHDVVEVQDLGPDPGDESLLRLATSQSRVVVTIDSDYGTMIFRDAAAHRGLVRLPAVPVVERIRLMNEVLSDHASALEAGAIITVKGNRIRISW